MGLFSKKPSENALKIIDFLGCPCTYFPAGKPAQLIQSNYEEAFAVKEMGGYTPLLIVVDDLFVEWVDMLRHDEFKPGETPEQFRQRLLSNDLIDAKKWLVERLADIKEASGEYWNELIAQSNQRVVKVDKLSGFIDYTTNKSSAVILAKIPTDKPWEIFAWLPFGGWNECPDAQVMLSVGKYWYEKFRAFPALISHDTLEFVALPVTDKRAALDLSLEQYAFCPDIVDQGVGLISVLAGQLELSTVWYFWWD